MSQHLNYPGDLIDTLPGRVMGPDLFGAHYVVTVAVHDPATDTTRAMLVPLPPGEPRLYLDEHQQPRLLASAIADGRVVPLAPPTPAAAPQEG